ncbi:RDD family protein [Rhodoflexus caldus]|uniref:RDD family protein n=1 Tax=Rhodoflexus caldus TaxID=2891236 RepID=UPI002029EB02|nr:RDD family protein [Rhodoflexus caldus]
MEFQLATPGQRFLAALIDGLVVTVAVLAASAINSSLGTVVNLLGLGYQLTKDAIPQLGGQSIGKKAMKIKVVKEDTGEMITGDWGTSIIRYVSLLIPFFNIIDALMVFSGDRRRFGDKWAKTVVVQE